MRIIKFKNVLIICLITMVWSFVYYYTSYNENKAVFLQMGMTAVGNCLILYFGFCQKFDAHKITLDYIKQKQLEKAYEYLKKAFDN